MLRVLLVLSLVLVLLLVSSVGISSLLSPNYIAIVSLVSSMQLLANGP